MDSRATHQPQAMHPTDHKRGAAVFIQRGSRVMLGIVVRSDIAVVGQPGVHRYRYTITPARIRDGVPVAIPGTACSMEFKHVQLAPFDANAVPRLTNWKF